MEHLFLMFLDHTQQRTTVGRTPLEEWSARRRELYLTTHDTHNRQISMPPVGFEPKISADERPQAAHLLRSWISSVSSHTHLTLLYGKCDLRYRSSWDHWTRIWTYTKTKHHVVADLPLYITNTSESINWINQKDAATSQVYYLSFKYSLTCFGHPHAHHRELQQLQ